MPSVNFIDQETVIPAAWSNDVDRFVFEHRGALLFPTPDGVDFSVPNNTLTAMPWPEEAYDSDGFHDPVTNNSRITIPSGVSVVRFGGQIFWQPNGTGFRTIFLVRNGLSGDTDPGAFRITQPGTSVVGLTQQGISAPLFVTPGDFYELFVFQTSGAALGISIDADPLDVRNFFFVEVLH